MEDPNKTLRDAGFTILQEKSPGQGAQDFENSPRRKPTPADAPYERTITKVREGKIK
jgi:hypothetical protein